ncbi:MAG: hypothetical protein PHN88_09005 [Ignavibacteria bacterium]|nr:hypothetical protein [Ignavibacteria bacterium]
MKKIITFSIILLLIVCSYLYPQTKPGFAVSIGTTFGSYAGADFGKTWAVSFPRSSFNDDYYYKNYYYHPSYDRYNFYSPVILDLGMDFYLNNYAAINVESSFIWHFNGYPDRQYETGVTHGMDYIDKWDNANLFALPLFLNLKLYPLGRQRSSFFITAGYGQQYTSESVDRVREEYDYNYGYSNYRYVIGSAESKKWLSGIKVGLGFVYPISPFMSGEAELKVTNFFPHRNTASPLAMNSSTNITFIGITTKLYFGF